MCADEQSRVPPVGDSAWRSSARVPDAMVAGCRTEQGYFAMVNVTQLRPQQKDVRLQAWFQSVHGRRLLRH